MFVAIAMLSCKKTETPAEVVIEEVVTEEVIQLEQAADKIIEQTQELESKETVLDEALIDLE